MVDWCPFQEQGENSRKGREILYSLLMLDAQRFPLVHTQGSCALPEAIAFWPILLAITRLAIDLFSMHGHSGAVQILLADHWGGDRGMVRCNSQGPPGSRMQKRRPVG